MVNGWRVSRLWNLVEKFWFLTQNDNDVLLFSHTSWKKNTSQKHTNIILKSTIYCVILTKYRLKAGEMIQDGDSPVDYNYPAYRGGVTPPPPMGPGNPTGVGQCGGWRGSPTRPGQRPPGVPQAFSPAASERQQTTSVTQSSRLSHPCSRSPRAPARPSRPPLLMTNQFTNHPSLQQPQGTQPQKTR